MDTNQNKDIIMLDDRFIKMVDDLYAPEIFKRDEVLVGQFNSKTSQLVKAGRAGGGAAQRAYGEVAMNEVEARIQIYYQLVMRVAGMTGVKVDEAFKQGAVRLIKENGDKQVSILNAALINQPYMKDVGGDFPYDWVQKNANNQIQKAEAEIQLALMAAERPQQANAPVFNINGSGIVVQTGANSVSNFTQHITQHDKDAIASALKVLRAKVGGVEPFQLGSSKDDLVESIDIAVDQLGKEKPNIGLVKSVLGGISSTVGLVADLQPAWTTVKTAAANVVGMLM